MRRACRFRHRRRSLTHAKVGCLSLCALAAQNRHKLLRAHGSGASVRKRFGDQNVEHGTVTARFPERKRVDFVPDLVGHLQSDLEMFTHDVAPSGAFWILRGKLKVLCVLGI
jgi:hypothetical protein